MDSLINVLKIARGQWQLVVAGRVLHVGTKAECIAAYKTIFRSPQQAAAKARWRGVPKIWRIGLMRGLAQKRWKKI